MRATWILFDFDGVLADSFSVASSLAKRACALNTADVYRSAFEGNLYDSLNERDSTHVHTSECEVDLDWWEEYERSFPKVRAFEGITGVVRELARTHSLAIVTSGKRGFIEPFLGRHGLEQCFKDILDVDVHTHKTKKIEILFERYKIGAKDCLFVTDTLGDIREAAEHSIASVACSWGWHPRETLEKGVPFRIVDSPREILDAAADFFGKIA